MLFRSLSEHYDLEDRILKYYPGELKKCEECIARGEDEAVLVERHRPQGKEQFSPMTLKGVVYTEKSDAGEMLLTVCKENPLSEPVEIGSYRGFKMEVFYDTVGTCYCLNLCAKAKHKVELGTDASGNLTRIEHVLNGIPISLESEKARKKELLIQLENAREEIKKPFAFEKELKEKSERLNALNIELNLDEKDPTALDMAPEPETEPPEKKTEGWER